MILFCESRHTEPHVLMDIRRCKVQNTFHFLVRILKKF